MENEEKQGKNVTVDQEKGNDCRVWKWEKGRVKEKEIGWNIKERTKKEQKAKGKKWKYIS